jgi:hypothetical protein
MGRRWIFGGRDSQRAKAKTNAEDAKVNAKVAEEG